MNSKHRHIVILTPGFPANEMDSECIPALQVYLHALNQLQDINITVLTFDYPYEKKVYNWKGITVHAFGNKNKKHSLLSVDVKVWKTLKRIHLAQKITVLHSFWLGPSAFIGYYFSRKYQLAHVTTLMGQDAIQKKGYLKLLPLQQMNFVTLSEYHQEKFEKTYGLNSIIIPWGIAHVSTEINENKSIDILGVGALTELKNYELFIDVVNEIAVDIKDLNVVLIGIGNQYNALQEKIESLGLEKHIKLLGNLSREQVLSIMKKAKVFLHTSSYESFGFVFAEALSYHMKIVSFEVGVAENHDNWKVVEDKLEMINAVLSFLRDKSTYVVTNQYVVEDTIKHYISLFEKQLDITNSHHDI